MVDGNLEFDDVLDDGDGDNDDFYLLPYHVDELLNGDDHPMDGYSSDDEERYLNSLVDSAATERNIYITSMKTNLPDDPSLSSTVFHLVFCIIHRTRSDSSDSATEAQILCTCRAFEYPFRRFTSARQAKAVVTTIFFDNGIFPYSFDNRVLWKELITADEYSSAVERVPLHGLIDVVTRISEAAVRVVSEASAFGRKVVEMVITIDKRTVVPNQEFERILIPGNVQISAIWDHDDPEMYLAIRSDFFSQSTSGRVGDIDFEDVFFIDDQFLEDDDDQHVMNRVIEQSILESTAAFESVPAAKSVVEALEKFKYEGSSEDEDESKLMTCVICMEEVIIGSQLTRMPCFHLFHEDCISPWLLEHHICPLCRFKFPSE